MEYVFTHICQEATETAKRSGYLFARYIKDGEPVQAECPGCKTVTTDAVPMKRQLTAQRTIQTDYMYNYRSPLDGSVITSRTQHRDHMRKHGVVEMGNEYPKQVEQDNSPMSRAGHDIVRSMER